MGALSLDNFSAICKIFHADHRDQLLSRPLGVPLRHQLSDTWKPTRKPIQEQSRWHPAAQPRNHSRNLSLSIIWRQGHQPLIEISLLGARKIRTNSFILHAPKHPTFRCLQSPDESGSRRSEELILNAYSGRQSTHWCCYVRGELRNCLAAQARRRSLQRGLNASMGLQTLLMSITSMTPHAVCLSTLHHEAKPSPYPAVCSVTSNQILGQDFLWDMSAVGFLVARRTSNLRPIKYISSIPADAPYMSDLFRDYNMLDIVLIQVHGIARIRQACYIHNANSRSMVLIPPAT